METLNKNGTGKTLQAVIVIVGVLVVGGGLVAYFNNFQSPEKVVQKMMEGSAEVKSLEYSGKIEMEMESDTKKQASNISMDFTGSSDIFDLKNPKSLLSASLNMKEFGQGDFSLSLEARSALSPITNQWIKIDIDALEKRFKINKSTQEWSPEQIEKLKISLKKNKIFKVTGTLESEKIEGEDTFHYKFTIEKEGIKKFINDVIDITQDKKLTEEELAEFDKGFETLKSPSGEIWIGKKSFSLYKISFNSEIKDIGKLGDEKSGIITPEISGKISFVLSFKNFNKPVQIDIPSPVKTFEQIFGGLLGELQGGGLDGSPKPIFPSPVN